MKVFIIVTLFAILIMGCTTVQEKKYKISGKILQTSSYCGGTISSQELIDQMKKEKPFPNKKLYIRNGNINTESNVVQEFTSSEDGKFIINLPSGKYCIIEDIKKDELKIPDFSEMNKNLPSYSQYHVESDECFQNWWSTCDNVLSVENKDISNFEIRFHQSCSQPCVSGGPIPQ